MKIKYLKCFVICMAALVVSILIFEIKKQYTMLEHLNQYCMECIPNDNLSARTVVNTIQQYLDSKHEKVAVFNNGSFDITSRNGKNKNNESVKKPQTKKQESVNTSDSDKLDKPGNEYELLACNTASENKQIEENKKIIQKLYQKKSLNYLLQKFYIVDRTTSIDKKIFNVKKLIHKDLSITKKKEPQILIIHTHGASEGFIDSKKGVKKDTIVGVGSNLANILTKEYGYHVIHDETQYDLVNGAIDRNKAYSQAKIGLQKQINKYPQIQVIIDLHRDGVGNKVHRTTVIDGKKTAQVMFFNGLSRNRKGSISYLPNPNLQSNLAFSLKMKLSCMRHFANFAKPVYLKGYRYNMNFKERYLLIELGNENNTLEEANNAMKPLAFVLNQVLSGKE